MPSVADRPAADSSRVMRVPRPRTASGVASAIALSLLTAVVALSLPAAAGSSPLGYEEPETWIGPVYFSWFRVDGRGRPVGQFYSPWVPKEGRGKWDGSVKFHKRHLRHIAQAGFNMIFAVSIHGYEEQETHLFEAIKRRKRRGLPVPKVAPFFAAGSFECRECPKRFGGPHGKNEFFAAVSGWYERFFSVLGPDDLAFYDGRVLTGVWWVPGNDSAGEFFFEEINRRLSREFGLEAFWSVNFTWENADWDELNYTFATLQGFTANEIGNLDLLTGFWPPGSQPRENFLAREGGDTYREAWRRALLHEVPGACGQRPRRITITSYNELTEGSGIYPAKCVSHTPQDSHWSGTPDFERCGDQPCHPHRKRDTWARHCNRKGAAKLYLNISRDAIRELARLQPPPSCDPRAGAAGPWEGRLEK